MDDADPREEGGAVFHLDKQKQGFATQLGDAELGGKRFGPTPFLVVVYAANRTKLFLQRTDNTRLVFCKEEKERLAKIQGSVPLFTRLEKKD